MAVLWIPNPLYKATVTFPKADVNTVMYDINRHNFFCMLLAVLACISVSLGHRWQKMYIGGFAGVFWNGG